MTDAHRRYLVIEQGVGAGIVNFVLNAVIAWLMFRSLDQVPLWGQSSIAGDTIGTTFFLPFLSTLIVTPLARQQIRNGRLPAVDWDCRASALRRLPRRTFVRGLALGLAGVLLVAPPSLYVLNAVHLEQLAFWPFIVFKATFAALLGAAVTPFIARRALEDMSGAVLTG